MKKKLVTGLAVVSLLSAGLIVALNPNQVKRGNASTSKLDVTRQYFVGDLIEVPDHEFTPGVKAKKTIYYPNGRKFSKDSFVPTDMGEYKITYTSGSEYLEDKIYVADHKYGITGEGSASYSKHKYTPNNDSLIVTLSPGAVFEYKDVINIKDRDYKKPLFNFYPVTSTPRLPDAYTMRVRLTDVYDSSRYLEVVYDSSREGLKHGVTYIKAGGHNQPKAGIELSWGKVHYDNIWGFPQNLSMYCCKTDASLFTELEYLQNNTSFYFDYETGACNSNKNNLSQSEICNVYNTTIFDELWEGTSTGECRLSVWFENYVSAEATVCFTNIDSTDIATDLLIDEIGPILKIDEVFEEMPHAVLGRKYRFFDVEAYDQHQGELIPSVKVYQNYYSNFRTNVDADDEGFIPRKEGTYYIEYSAKDYSNNSTSEVYEIECLNKKHHFELSLEDGYKTEAFVGETVKLAKLKIKGAYGDCKLIRGLILPDGTRVKADSSFRPLVPGKYRVEYVVVDYIGNALNRCYDINVTISDKPIIVGDAKISPYYIAGYTYKLTELTGVDYSDNESIKPVSVKIVENGVEKDVINNELVLDQTDEKVREATIRYVCSNANGKTTKDYPIKVYSTAPDGFIHMEKYFDLVNAESSSNADNVTISSSKNGTATFINDLSAAGFEANFSIDAINNKLKKVNIYLTDSENEDETLKVSYLPSDGFAKVIINDNENVVREAIGAFAGGSQSIKFDVNTHRFQFKTNESIEVKKFLNGEPFTGFSSGSVYLKFEFDNPRNNLCELHVTNLNGQKISNFKYDYIEPRIVLDGDYGGTVEYKDSYTICSAKAFDVLDPNPSIILNAIGPDGKPIKDIEGVILSDADSSNYHIFNTDVYGDYRINYVSIDYDGNEANFTYLVGVYDRIAPTITLNGSNKTSARVNDDVSFVSMSVSDNYSKTENIETHIYIIHPTGTLEMVKDNHYKFTMSGEYIIRYIAIDEAQNMSIVDNHISIKEA